MFPTDQNSFTHMILMKNDDEYRPTNSPFLLTWLQSIGQQLFVMIGAYKTWVAILFQEQIVNVLSGFVESESRRTFHLVLDDIHCPTIDIDLARSSRCQKFPFLKIFISFNLNW